MDLNKVIHFANKTVKAYVDGVIDHQGFHDALATFPDALWRERDSALFVITTLAEDEGLCHVLSEKSILFSEFLCDLLPKAFWDTSASVLGITEYLLDYLMEYYEYISCNDFLAIARHIPQEFWEDRAFALGMCDLLARQARAMEGLECLDDLIPPAVFNDPTNVRYAVLSLCEVSGLNAVEFALYPKAVWEHAEMIFWILSNLKDELSGGNFTMYPLLRGSRREYLEELLGYVSPSFRSDREFILELLDAHYFFNDFDLIYDWVDETLWGDKEFVMQVLENDDSPMERISKELLLDEEVKALLEECSA